MAMFILSQSRKRKMATGNRSCESALEELVGVLLCRTGEAHVRLVWLDKGAPIDVLRQEIGVCGRGLGGVVGRAS